MSAAQISDEMLTAYLDSELDAHEVAQVEDAIKESPAILERLRSLDIVKQDLKPALDLLLKDAPAAPFIQKPQPKSAPQFLLRSATAIAALLVAGVILLRAFPMNSTDQLALVERIAVYQDLYVNETLSTLSFTEVEKSRQLDFLSERIGYDLSTFENVKGLEFVRGQLLGFEGENLAHLSYLSDSGLPIALCAIRLDSPEYAGAFVTEVMGMTAVQWQDSGYQFFLIGDVEADVVDMFLTSLS